MGNPDIIKTCVWVSGFFVCVSVFGSRFISAGEQTHLHIIDSAVSFFKSPVIVLGFGISAAIFDTCLVCSPLRFAFDDYDYYVIICEPNKTIAMVSLEWFVFVCVLIWQHFRDFISTQRNI